MDYLEGSLLSSGAINTLRGIICIQKIVRIEKKFVCLAVKEETAVFKNWRHPFFFSDNFFFFFSLLS
jgi:hypothetical protein